MIAVQIIENDACVETRLFDATAVLTNAATVTSDLGVYAAPAGCTLMMQAGAGIGWTLVNGVLVAPAAPAPTQAQLVAYAEQVRVGVAAGGISVNIAAVGAPAQMIAVSTSQGGLLDLAGAVQMSGLNPAQSFTWVLASGPVALTAEQVQQLGLAAGSFVQATWAELAAVLAAIAAGTITATAQIDDPTQINLPAWPANS